MTDRKNHIPFDEDNYTHNIERNNERMLDRRGFMKTLVGAAGLFAISSLPWGTIAAKELMGLAKKSIPERKSLLLRPLPLEIRWISLSQVSMTVLCLSV